MESLRDIGIFLGNFFEISATVIPTTILFASKTTTLIRKLSKWINILELWQSRDQVAVPFLTGIFPLLFSHFFTDLEILREFFIYYPLLASILLCDSTLIDLCAMIENIHNNNNNNNNNHSKSANNKKTFSKLLTKFSELHLSLWGSGNQRQLAEISAPKISYFQELKNLGGKIIEPALCGRMVAFSVVVKIFFHKWKHFEILYKFFDSRQTQQEKNFPEFSNEFSQTLWTLLFIEEEKSLKTNPLPNISYLKPENDNSVASQLSHLLEYFLEQDLRKGGKFWETSFSHNRFLSSNPQEFSGGIFLNSPTFRFTASATIWRILAQIFKANPRPPAPPLLPTTKLNLLNHLLFLVESENDSQVGRWHPKFPVKMLGVAFFSLFDAVDDFAGSTLQKLKQLHLFFKVI